jgi:carboxymethylenebutenolidase
VSAALSSILFHEGFMIEGIDSHKSEMSRRRLGVISAAGAAATAMPALAALSVIETDVTVPTGDGTSDAVFARPSTGTYPGVIVWPDAFGLRPAFRDMGKRLAAEGYAVLTVNPFYREGKAPRPVNLDFNNPDDRKRLMGMIGELTDERILKDANAYVAFLDSQASVNTKAKIGTQGYCMGGRLTMLTAAAEPDRVGAGASFHGGGLTTDKPNSPHLLVPKITAQYLFAVADDDDQAEPESKTKLKDAFAKVGKSPEIEVYKGALHGWCVKGDRMKDGKLIYNEPQAEKAWSRLLTLYKAALV